MLTMHRVWVAVALLALCGGCGESDPEVAGGDASASVDPSFQVARAACTFTGGATVKDTLGLSDAARASIPIKYAIILMKENRSFDHVFGKLHEQGQPGTEPIPADFKNPNFTHDQFFSPFHAPTTCWSQDLGH